MPYLAMNPSTQSLLMGSLWATRELAGIVFKWRKERDERRERVEHYAVAHLGTLVDETRAEIGRLRQELDIERTARRAAETGVHGLRQELADMRLALTNAGCVAVDCIKGGKCTADDKITLVVGATG